MDRRSFVVRAAGALPVLSVLVAAKGNRDARFKDVTQVTVNHDGDKPVDISVVGLIGIVGPGGTTIERHDKAQPLKLKTPASFVANVERDPAVIEADGKQFIRVTADHSTSNQHLYARAPRVTIRRATKPGVLAPNASQPIEIIGEASANK